MCKGIWVWSVFVLLILTAPVSFAAQNPAPPAQTPAERFAQQFWQQADALRPKLDEWKNIVDALDFSKLKMGKDGDVVLHTLEGDKAQSLDSLVTLWLQIPLAGKLETVSPAQEYQIMLQIIFLHNQLSKLQSDLMIGYTSAFTSGSMTFDSPDAQTVRGWSGSLSQIAAELGNHFLMRMQTELRGHLVMLQGELAQCNVGKPTNP